MHAIRRRRLPHFHHQGLIQSVTFRLADSLPAGVLEAWIAELSIRRARRDDQHAITELHSRIERYTDSGHGSCWLAQDGIGKAMVETLHEQCGKLHKLLAWCVMPNHVHVLVEPKGATSLPGLVRGWKANSARIANRLIGRTGAFWMRGYHDRYIRDEMHLQQAIGYIEDNPVKAGLVHRAEDWAFSSAWKVDCTRGTP